MAGIVKETSSLVGIKGEKYSLEALRNRVINRRSYLVCKRILDVIVSVFVILFLLSWLIPLLALIIKLDSKGPVFFIQKRVGFLGSTFRCFKLRTMCVNTLCDSQQAIADDPRITRVGRFLRITSLDELPQFLNVLIGDMSVVGPRPHMFKDNQDFGKVVENYRLRYFVKPGITGMAQVKGYRGPAQDFQKIFHRYQWDAFYIRNACLSLDFKIMRLTAIQVAKSLISVPARKRTETDTSRLAFARSVSE
jgi:putative colanic acid biosynthesis UDP-glucose lipid carrier transferase